MKPSDALCQAQKKELRTARVQLFCIVILTLSLASLAMCIGRYSMTPGQMLYILFSPLFRFPETWSVMDYNIVFRVRLPRVCAAIMVGGGLSLSGATYQGIFQNPLVAPDLLGISAGACVGAASAILLNLGSTGLQTFALCGGLAAVGCSMMIPKLLKNSSSLMLVLSGVIVSGFMNAMIGILKYMADTETQLPAITYWQMGSMADVNPEQMLSVFPAMLVSVIILIGLRWRVNLLSLGDTEAAALGVNHRTVRTVLILCATLLTGCSVCISGIVGWVGLIIPHFTRLLTGPDNTRLIPLSFFTGGCFMLIVDTLARTVTAAEIPLSILTGAIGAPLFVWLLVRTRTRL